MNILVTGANGQLGNEMRILAARKVENLTVHSSQLINISLPMSIR